MSVGTAAMVQLALIVIAAATGYFVGRFVECERCARYMDRFKLPAVASQIRRGVHRRKP